MYNYRMKNASHAVGTGLGFEAVRHLARDANNNIFLCSRDAKNGQAAAEKVLQEHSQAKVTPIKLDVTDDCSIAEASMSY